MDARDIHEGMKVHGSDGGNLGKVVMMNEENFIIEKGFFFPKEYTARYGQIADIRNDEIWLRESRDELRRGREASGAAAGTERPSERRHGIPGAREEVNVPLAEEELEVSARERERGEVRVRKDVVSEEREIEVPVRHEEVYVERVPATGKAAAEANFEGGETRVPVYEEEVEVHTRPVVREEVRVGKRVSEDTERVRGTVRKETAEIDDEALRRGEHRNR